MENAEDRFDLDIVTPTTPMSLLDSPFRMGLSRFPR